MYEQSEWWSDKWNPKDYCPANGIDFSRWFFEQFEELANNVPKINLNWHHSNENSEFVNFIVQAKNSYLCFWWGFWEDILYSTLNVKSKNCVDTHFCFSCEESYEISYCNDCYKLLFSYWCSDCSDSFYLENCDWCKNCFWCLWLKNSNYCIFNEKYDKEEYFKFIDSYFNDLEKKEKITGKIKDFFNKKPKINLDILNSDNSTGNHIYSSNNCVYSNNIKNSENLKFVDFWISNLHDSYDSEHIWVNSQLLYEVMTASVNINKSLFSLIIRENCSNLHYCSDISSSSNLFWCIWLRNSQYCILNKQYTRQEYETLVSRIIEHMMLPHPSSPNNRGDAEGGGVMSSEWWEFFPSSISPFGYNETVANEYYPLEKQEALSKNFKWSDYENPAPQVSKTIPAFKLPDNIQDIPDDILNWA
ncbi:MAG: hypothetical protein ACD_4C00119G0001, partial [uncultured bacterium (gcode 4)]